MVLVQAEFGRGKQASKQAASKQASNKQANKHASTQASKQASKQAGKQASKASKQASKQASKAKQSKAQQSKAKQSKAKQASRQASKQANCADKQARSKAKQSKAKQIHSSAPSQSQAKYEHRSKAKQSKAISGFKAKYKWAGKQASKQASKQAMQASFRRQAKQSKVKQSKAKRFWSLGAKYGRSKAKQSKANQQTFKQAGTHAAMRSATAVFSKRWLTCVLGHVDWEPTGRVHELLGVPCSGAGARHSSGWSPASSIGLVALVWIGRRMSAECKVLRGAFTQQPPSRVQRTPLRDVVMSTRGNCPPRPSLGSAWGPMAPIAPPRRGAKKKMFQRGCCPCNVDAE